VALHAQAGALSTLVVCAVDAEAVAVVGTHPHEQLRLGPLRGRRLHTGAGAVDVVASGVGPAHAAAATATALAHGGHALVLNIGVAGAFSGGGAVIGGLVVGDRLVADDLGVLAPTGYLDVETLGFGHCLGAYDTPPALADALVTRLSATGQPVARGTVLTLSSFTGTDTRAAELVTQHAAVAEAMEGTGVATAAALVGVPAAEVRAISNLVGDRDREAWRLPEALAALTLAGAALLAAALPVPVPVSEAPAA